MKIVNNAPMFGEDTFSVDPRKLNGGKIYMNMVDNMNKVVFDVLVTESYNPNIHYSYLRPGAPPPIQSPGPFAEGELCKAKLSVTHIVDALANNQQLEFCNMEDMRTVEKWLGYYLSQFKDVSVAHDPEQAAFLKSAERVYAMLSGNIRKADDHERYKQPKKMGIAEILKFI